MMLDTLRVYKKHTSETVEIRIHIAPDDAEVLLKAVLGLVIHTREKPVAYEFVVAMASALHRGAPPV
jgi:hypothetical protein